jgi:PiT family inorganic phosphate transporter
MDPFTVAIFIVLLGLLFDYTNGFHDAANVVSTVIATRALAPLTAIVLAGVLNTLGASQVSAIVTTITSGLVDTAAVSQQAILSALLGAITWNIITWYFGIPSSSSYALVGALIGATIQSASISHVLWKGLTYKVLIPMIVSPFLGFFFSFLLMKALCNFIEKERHLP